jgi:hypothetical protein
MWSTARERIDGRVTQLRTQNWSASVSPPMAGPVIGNLPGEVVRVLLPGPPRSITALGVAVSGEDMYEVSVGVPEHSTKALSWLAHRATLAPGSP